MGINFQHHRKQTHVFPWKVEIILVSIRHLQKSLSIYGQEYKRQITTSSVPVQFLLNLQFFFTEKLGLKPRPRRATFQLIFFHRSCRHAFESTINIYVAGGHTETKNGLLGKCKTTAKVATACETSTRRGARARYESPYLQAGEDVNQTTIRNNNNYG